MWERRAESKDSCPGRRGQHLSSNYSFRMSARDHPIDDITAPHCATGCSHLPLIFSASDRLKMRLRTPRAWEIRRKWDAQGGGGGGVSSGLTLFSILVFVHGVRGHLYIDDLT